jgi:hypothetical protein
MRQRSNSTPMSSEFHVRATALKVTLSSKINFLEGRNVVNRDLAGEAR